MSDKIVCLVGSGATRDYAPFNNPDVEIWTTVSVSADLPRADVVFELHNNVYTNEYLDSIQAHKFLKNENALVSNSERFPIEKLEEEFGKIFPGSMSMILSFAYLCGYKKFVLYGIDLTADSEYGKMRELFMYLVGYLRAKGCEIEITKGSGINDTCLTYMYDVPRDDLGIKTVIEKAKRQLEADKKASYDIKWRLGYSEGFIDAIKYCEGRKQ